MTTMDSTYLQRLACLLALALFWALVIAGALATCHR